MTIEEPVGFTADGKLITGLRLTESELADICMANEMYWASPEGRAQMRAALDSLPAASVTINLRAVN